MSDVYKVKDTVWFVLDHQILSGEIVEITDEITVSVSDLDVPMQLVFRSNLGLFDTKQELKKELLA